LRHFKFSPYLILIDFLVLKQKLCTQYVFGLAVGRIDYNRIEFERIDYD